MPHLQEKNIKPFLIRKTGESVRRFLKQGSLTALLQDCLSVKCFLQLLYIQLDVFFLQVEGERFRLH